MAAMFMRGEEARGPFELWRCRDIDDAGDIGEVGDVAREDMLCQPET